MNSYSRLAILAGILVSGCATKGPQGVFEPACIAHAGDRIEMSGGRFEWDRFTDHVNVDDSGNRIDPYPDYPKTGTVATGKFSKLEFTGDDGTAVGERYLLDYRGRTYLLTYEQNEAVLDGEEMPACALVRVPND